MNNYDAKSCLKSEDLHMRVYNDRNQDSGVRAFELGEDSITVQFKDNSTYLYTSQSAGADHLQAMKRLAENGDGLNSYINRFVRNRYLSKVR
jgi:hypothetical protein